MGQLLRYHKSKPTAFTSTAIRWGLALFLGWRLLGEVSMAVAGDEARKEEGADLAYTQRVRPILQKYCVDCHGEKKAKNDLRLDTLDSLFRTAQSAASWKEVTRRVVDEADDVMPPKGKPRPSPEEIKALREWIGTKLSAVAAADLAHRKSQGRALVRRLNRDEYNNSINDLLGIERDLRGLLPEDGTAYGFDTVDTGLDLSTNHLERYMLAANVALDVAFSRFPTVTQRYVLNTAEHAKKPSHPLYLLHACCAEQDRMIFFGPQYVQRQLGYFGGQWKDQYGRVTEAGRYRYRIQTCSVQDPGKLVSMIVYVGECRLGSQNRFVGNFDVTAEPTVVEFTVFQNAGDTMRFEPYGTPKTPYGIPKPKSGVGKPEDWTAPGLAVYWIEAQGPLPEGSLAAPETREQGTFADGEAILRRFLPKAFRRPVTQDETASYLDMFRARLAKGYSFRDALQVALTAVLCSPDFLYLTTHPGRLNDFELAARLSYFLWSSTPDDTLLGLAAQGKLGKADVLSAQVERLLSDPKAHAFTENFTGQWLNLRDLWTNTPDPTFFGIDAVAQGAWDDFLIRSMLQETQLFFDDILQHDRSLLEFVQSDWSMLNRRLAEHYGIPGVQGQHFRKVTLPANSHRGGVITQASVLKVTANGQTTSPILRGVWVLKRILGQAPPPPPKNVEAPEPDIRGATTIREQLAKHRVGSCASCHKTIDPPGFALESFDPIGRWREKYRTTKTNWRGRENGPAVDSTGELPGGKKFNNIDEFKQLLLENKDDIARCLTEKLMIYGTGHKLEVSDSAEIEQIVQKSRASQYGFRSLVREVALSELFRSK